MSLRSMYLLVVFPLLSQSPRRKGRAIRATMKTEVNSEDSGSALGREESEPGEIEDEIELSTTDTVTSRRAPLPESSTENGQGGVTCDLEGMVPSREDLTNALTATLRKMKRLVLHIPGPRGFSLRSRTRAEKLKLRGDDQQGALTVEDELQITLTFEDDAKLERAFGDDVGVLIVKPTGRIQDLTTPPPVTHAEFLRSPYRKAFEHSQHVEINGILDVGCFEPVDEEMVPMKRKIMGSKWVRTYKGDKLGFCVKTKSRSVAKGFTQVQDVDYHETTSPTPASPPVKILAVVANKLGLPVFYLDVSQAFVQPRLEKEMYIRLLPGCGELSNRIVKLLKCQYGLKQASREWHLLLVNGLVGVMRLEQCKAEPYVFRRIANEKVELMVGVHVDDIIVCVEKDACNTFLDELRQGFSFKTQGELRMYTGCTFMRDWESGVLEMNQASFVENLIVQFGTSPKAKILGSPGIDLGLRKEGEHRGNDEFLQYRALLGSLMWPSVMTRLDIVNALRVCARHSHNLSPRHWKAPLQVAAAYVNAMKEIGLRFVRESGLKLSVYADADYAVVSNDRMSVSGVVVMLGDTDIGWKSSTCDDCDV